MEKMILREQVAIPSQGSLPHSEEPIIHFVNQLLMHALQQNASDIHIEAFENHCRLRLRQDGLLFPFSELPKERAQRVITRLKIMAKLDIAESRRPQDGQFTLKLSAEQALNVRFSSCPTLQGEKVVLRLLDSAKQILDLAALGLTATQKNLLIKKLQQPQGLILVTGPTGSGKTVTLYSALDYLNSSQKNILTVEDPVEIQLKGINQVCIHSKTGLDFKTILRAFLRQDPDIIMVGEIRDSETANIALQAAQSGHLVLSTLHTNSALESWLRLFSMGLPAYQLTQALSLIIAQRLVRKVCPHCHALHVKGCDHCHQGYKGRIGIFECLHFSKKLKALMLQEAHPEVLLAAAQAEGFISLETIGLEKVKQGDLSLVELDRVLLREELS